MDQDEEARRESAVGELLRAARGRDSQRSAAARAGVSPTQWRHMENGQREHGVRVRASDKVLEAAALAVGLDPAELFEVAGRTYEGPLARERPAVDDDRLSALERRMDGLEAMVSRLVEGDR